MRSGAPVAAVSTPLLSRPCRSRATSKRSRPQRAARRARTPAGAARTAAGTAARRQPRVSATITRVEGGMAAAAARPRARSATQQVRAWGGRAASAAATGSAWTTSPSEESLTSAIRGHVSCAAGTDDVARAMGPKRAIEVAGGVVLGVADDGHAPADRRAPSPPPAPSPPCSRCPWRARPDAPAHQRVGGVLVEDHHVVHRRSAPSSSARSAAGMSGRPGALEAAPPRRRS